jgi:hypothetical protein
MNAGEQQPDLNKCHFSGDYSKAPWWIINFKKEQKVKSIKIFNL